MSPYTRGETIVVRPSHPEGKVLNCTGIEVVDHWGDDVTTEYQALILGYLNIQTFLTNVLHDRNGCIIKMTNDNHMNC